MAGVAWPESGGTNLTDLLGGGVVIASGSLCPFALQPGGSRRGLGGGQAMKGLASSGSSKPAGSTRRSQFCTFSPGFRRVSMRLGALAANLLAVAMAVLVGSAVMVVGGVAAM